MGRKRISWVKWSKVCSPKINGDLGVKDVGIFNETLLTKWKWSCFHQRNDMWVKIINSKYGGWDALGGVGSLQNQSIWWRDIKMVRDGDDGDRWFDVQVTWSLGDGMRTNFWHDNWMGEEPHFVRFPRIYVNSLSVEAKVGNLGYWEGGGWVWNFTRRHRWFEWEIQSFNQSEPKINLSRLNQQRCDAWWWNAEVNELFSVKSAHQLLHNRRFVTSMDHVFNKMGDIIGYH